MLHSSANPTSSPVFQFSSFPVFQFSSFPVFQLNKMYHHPKRFAIYSLGDWRINNQTLSWVPLQTISKTSRPPLLDQRYSRRRYTLYLTLKLRKDSWDTFHKSKPFQRLLYCQLRYNNTSISSPVGNPLSKDNPRSASIYFCFPIPKQRLSRENNHKTGGVKITQKRESPSHFAYLISFFL